MYNYSAVLCVGQDPQLLQLRCQVLATRFISVARSTSGDLPHTLAHSHFDLMVLCHTIAASECAAVVQQFRDRCADASIIAMKTNSLGCDQPDIDASVFALAGPAALFRTIDGLTRHGQPRFGLLHGVPAADAPVRPHPAITHPSTRERGRHGQVQHLG